MSGNERAKFPEGKQKKFLERSKKQLAFDSWIKFAEEIGVHRRSLIDWKEEEYTIPLKVLKKVCDILGTEIPSEIESKDRFWYTHKGGKHSRSGNVTYEKYGQVGGDPEYRKKKWREWREGREKEGKLKGLFKRKNIEKPPRSSKLAEFVGVMIGDGGISSRQVTVALNSEDDKEYIEVVRQMFEDLFELQPSVCSRKNSKCTRIVASSKALVEFCVSVGLKQGDKLKQGLDVPEWVKGNEKLEVPCLRGMMDTDGCVFNECHHINGKEYCYMKIAFVSKSEALRESTAEIMKGLGFKPRIRNQKSVKLEKEDEVKRYFDLVDTHNSKHRKRFEKFKGGVG